MGRELYVGVHSDEDILLNKGPVVMTLRERLAAVNACKWLTQAVPNAPYVTDPEYMAQHGCKYVVHGDDITTDANGEDCYQSVKDLGMFVVVKRTPNISTTDLVGRMLLMSKQHHFRPFLPSAAVLDHPLFADEGALVRFRQYASHESGHGPNTGVYVHVDGRPLETVVPPSPEVAARLKSITYIDGGFDLFHPGHIEALRQVHLQKDPASLVVVGLHDDKAINEQKGLNYPIMSLFERALCVLQCRYVDSVVIGAPYVPTKDFLDTLPGKVVLVVHGPTDVDLAVYDDVRPMFVTLPSHQFADINTELIVERVLSNKKAYEDRQARKGWKAEVEKKLLEKEQQDRK